MKATFVSRFTPSMMSYDALEGILVQRRGLVRRITDLIRDSALTQARHHTLLIGPRGIGKTHLVALVYHRIKAMEDLRPRLLVAVLREEEWGVGSLLDLVLRILRALTLEYQDASLHREVEGLYRLSPGMAEREAIDLLLRTVGGRTLLVLLENLDELFAGIGEVGQKRLRALIQEHPIFAIVATSQSLFGGVSLQTSPFYGFFRVHHLKGLSLDEAVQLLLNIARYEGNRELEEFLRIPLGRARIRAIHHLAGGNHRVYVILSQFLTHLSIDGLVEPLMQTLDDLTPYYQARMMWLSPQQRKIVEFLMDRRGSASVKEIAQRSFITHQTASGQLRSLKEMGYVQATSVGRESFYELREPLMRLSLEVKRNRGEPIRLLVDFLRLWYAPTEIEEQLGLLSSDSVLEREYLSRALHAAVEQSEDPRVSAATRDYDHYLRKERFVDALRAAEELAAVRGASSDWVAQGYCLARLSRFEEALESLDRASSIDPKDVSAWQLKGMTLHDLERFEEALDAFTRATDTEPGNARAWLFRGEVLAHLGRVEDSLTFTRKAVELNGDDDLAWLLHGQALVSLNRFEESLEAFDRVTQLKPNDEDGWYHKGDVFARLDRHEEALQAFSSVLTVNPRSARALVRQGQTLQELHRSVEALAAFSKALELSPGEALAWHGRAQASANLGFHEEALASENKAVELAPQNPLGWWARGQTLVRLSRYSDALASFEKAIELGLDMPCVKFDRTEALLLLGEFSSARTALDETLSRFAKDETHVVGHSAGIILKLFADGRPEEDWRSSIRLLSETYEKHGVSRLLAQGLVRNIPAFISPTVEQSRRGIWKHLWHEVNQGNMEFALPLRLLDAAVAYSANPDPRIMLELPIEERAILEPLLHLDENSSARNQR